MEQIAWYILSFWINNKVVGSPTGDNARKGFRSHASVNGTVTDKFINGSTYLCGTYKYCSIEYLDSPGKEQFHKIVLSEE